MHRVSHSIEIAVPADVCFEYIDKVENLPECIFGLKSSYAVGPSEPRLGTQLEGTMQLGPVRFKSGGRITEYVENELIRLTIEQGPISGTASWQFEQAGAENCAITIAVAYQIAGGLTGRALTRVIDTVMEPALQYSEHNLRKQVTAYYQALSRE